MFNALTHRAKIKKTFFASKIVKLQNNNCQYKTYICALNKKIQVQ